MRLFFLAFALASAAGAQAASAPTWTLTPRPIVEIGDDADPPKLFNRIGSVGRLGDGSIVVANGGSAEIRVFAPNGEYLRTISRKGRGPGELNVLGRLIFAGDTIIAPESQPGASVIHLFSPTGFLSRVQLKSPGRGGITLADRFPDGRVVVTPGFRVVPELPPGTMYTDTVQLGVMALSATATPAWFGDFPSGQLWMIDSPFVPGRPFPVNLSFGLQRARAVSGDRLWVGNSQTGLVLQFNSAGKQINQFTVPIQPRPLDREVLERVKARQLAEAQNQIEKVRLEGLYGAPRPRLAPLFTTFVPGANGEMWLRLFDEDPAAPAAFLVLDRSGRALGRATMPRGFTPHDIGPDYILGVHRDEDGIEHVVEYGLQRR